MHLRDNKKGKGSFHKRNIIMYLVKKSKIYAILLLRVIFFVCISVSLADVRCAGSSYQKMLITFINNPKSYRTCMRIIATSTNASYNGY